ncbi:unnamed protein product [Arabidopsis halleri]
MSHLKISKICVMSHSNTATGRNAVGLGYSIDADTYQVRENDGTNDPSRVQIMDDAEEITYEETSVHDVLSSLERRSGGKLPQRKKARTDAFNSNKVFDEVNTVTEFSNQIFGMIQKRWEKETEEKEAEDKANNVWDAIKEIPDLDVGLRYEAMTLVHSLDRRNVSVEEMLATFLFIVGQNSRYIQAQDRFKRSRFSISTSFNTILKVLKALAPSYMAKPGSAVPTKIKDSTRFYPYFKDCVGAIDGTHILAMITGQDSASYQRIFGIFKSRFLIFKSAPPFPYKTQADLVLACAVLHNYLRRECRSDLFLPEENDVEEADVHERDEDENNEEQLHGYVIVHVMMRIGRWCFFVVIVGNAIVIGRTLMLEEERMALILPLKLLL